MDIFYMPWINDSKPDDTAFQLTASTSVEHPAKASFLTPSSVFYAPSECDPTVKPLFKFTYMNAQGGAESIRLMLLYLQVPFIDNRISLLEFMEKQNDLKFRQLPLLELQDGTIISHNLPIIRFIATEYGLAGASSVERARGDEIAENMVELRAEVKGYIVLVIKKSYFNISADDPSELNIHLNSAQEGLDKYLPQLELACSGALHNKHGYILESGISYIDFVVANIYLLVCNFFPSQTTRYAALEHVRDKIHSLPQLQFYLESRPKTIY